MYGTRHGPGLIIPLRAEGCSAQGLWGQCDEGLSGEKVRIICEAGTRITYHGVRPVIMRLDMFEVACLPERRDVPVQLTHPEVDSGVAVTDRA